MNKKKDLQDILEDLKIIENRLTSLERNNDIEKIINLQVAKILELTLDTKIDQKLNERLKEKNDEVDDRFYSTRAGASDDGDSSDGGESDKKDVNCGAMKVYDDDISFDNSVQQTDIEKQTTSTKNQDNRKTVMLSDSVIARNRQRKSSLMQSMCGHLNYEEDSVIFPNEADGNFSSFEARLYRDSYALMTVSYPFKSLSWWFGTSVCILQLILLTVVIKEQDVAPDGKPLFNAPIHTSRTVSIAQFFAIIVALLMSTDMMEATKSIHLLLMGASYEENRTDLLKSIGSQTISKSDPYIYPIMVLLPNFLKFIEGFLVLFTSFIVIVQSSNVIDLFEDFLALQVISNIDDITFWLCLQGYFGKSLQRKSDEVTKITLKDFGTQEEEPEARKTKYLPSFHALISAVIYLIMVFGWGFVLHGQVSGKFYDSKYPYCQVKLQEEDFKKIGNGECDGGLFNRYECDFDGGDCVEFRLAYPDCLDPKVDPAKISNGKCDPENNYKECGYDGGDCCTYTEYDAENDMNITGLQNKVFSNGLCNATPEFNNEQCKFDNGDCVEHNRLYPGCFVQDVKMLNNSICDGGDTMTPECKWDGGDCNDCEIVIGANLSLVGNNICNGGIYFTDECGGNDGGDCDDCIGLGAIKSKIGDGHCDLGVYLNKECSHDGDDCLWKKLGQDLYGELNFDKFGVSTSISRSGNIIAVGGHTNDGNGDNSGYVQVYEYTNDKWIQMGSDINGENGGDESGRSISLSSDGRKIAIGALKNSGGGTQRGHVRLYEYVNNTWMQIGNIVGENDKDNFGNSVSLSSNGLIVASGAVKTSGDGYVEVYAFNGTLWNKLGEKIEGRTDSGRLGSAVSLSSNGQRVAISAPMYDDGLEAPNAGYVEIYEFMNSSWTPLGDFLVGKNGDTFGNSISLSANGFRLAVGAEQNDGIGGKINSGQVRVFDYNTSGTNWIEIGAIEGEDMSDYFGHSVSLSSDGSMLAAGGFYNDGGGDNAGHVRIFAYVDNSWVQVGEDIEGESEGDEFGSSVALSHNGRRVVIGGRLSGYIGKNAGHAGVYYID